MVRAILAGQKTQTRRPVKDLRVRLRHEVSSDIPAIIRPVLRYGPGVYRAGMNQHGAVHVIGEQGDLGVKPQEFDFLCPYAEGHTYLRRHPDGRMAWHIQVPEGQRLWVRETFRYVDDHRMRVAFRAGQEPSTDGRRWRPGIHLPFCHHRIGLEVTEVRVERLQAITEEDARAEGVPRDDSPCDHVRYSCEEIGCLGPGYRSSFAGLWDELHVRDGFTWKANPWVWAVSFRRVGVRR
jgi:hypothetical protein